MSTANSVASGVSGDKKEKSIYVPRQLVPAGDAVSTQDDSWRLSYLRSVPKSSWHFSFIHRLFTIYGPSISSASLRSGLLAWSDDVLPYEKKRESFVLRRNPCRISTKGT